jgi:hypothetical protein
MARNTISVDVISHYMYELYILLLWQQSSPIPSFDEFCPAFRVSMHSTPHCSAVRYLFALTFHYIDCSRQCHVMRVIHWCCFVIPAPPLPLCLQAHHRLTASAPLKDTLIQARSEYHIHCLPLFYASTMLYKMWSAEFRDHPCSVCILEDGMTPLYKRLGRRMCLERTLNGSCRYLCVCVLFCIYRLVRGCVHPIRTILQKHAATSIKYCIQM